MVSSYKCLIYYRSLSAINILRHMGIWLDISVKEKHKNYFFMMSPILTLEILERFAKGIAEVESHYLFTLSYLKYLLNEE